MIRQTLFAPGALSVPRVILASASPRRAELLSLIGIQFAVVPAVVDEHLAPHDDPKELALRLAKEKSAAVGALYPDCVVIGADTLVVVDAASTRILGKPRDATDAHLTLDVLSGRTHRVITGLSILTPGRTKESSTTTETEVTFRKLSAAEITAYIATGEPMDKAGAYGIQGLGALFVRSIRGSYTNVVGLPLAEFIEEMKGLGMWKEVS